jgi:hypothetical protein
LERNIIDKISTTADYKKTNFNYKEKIPTLIVFSVDIRGVEMESTPHNQPLHECILQN